MSRAGLKSRFLLVSSAALVLALLTACSKQGEGERCDFAVAGNSDCDVGLVCRKADVDRCCPPLNERSSDAHCDRSPAMPTAGSGSGAQAGSGQAGSGQAGSGGQGGLNGGTAGTQSEGGAPTANGGASAGEGGTPAEPEPTSGAGGAQ